MIKEKDFQNLVAFDPKISTTSSKYYRKVYEKYFEYFLFIKINWAGIAFGSTLFLYRRMYFYWILMLLFEQLATEYIMTFGFDWGMAHNYASIVEQVLTALIFNMLYMNFLKRKFLKKKRIGTHVRLFYPFVLFAKYLFGMLLFQCFALALNITFIINGVYYVIYFAFIYAIMLYIYYFWDWIKTPKELVA